MCAQFYFDFLKSLNQKPFFNEKLWKIFLNSINLSCHQRILESGLPNGLSTEYQYLLIENFMVIFYNISTKINVRKRFFRNL